MTELDRYYDPPTQPSPRTELESWSDEAAAAARIANQLANTPFVPASLRVIDRGRVDVAATTANIAAALLTGRELGLAPMAALRSIDIVNGTPALRAVALRALLQRAGHDIWVVESNATRAIVRGRRNGAGPDQTQESVWTLDRARSLGIAGKDNWRKQPQAMLIARATSEIARLVASDAILGLPYIVEEIQDTDPDQIDEPATAPEPKPRTARRRNPPPAATRALPAADDDPPLDEPAAEPAPAQPPTEPDNPDPDDEPPADRPRTEAQSKRLHATLHQLGVLDRDQALELITEIVGRDVTTTKDLTVTEAGRVIDDLDRRLTAEAEPAEDEQ
jgi:hypothetical protein